jgi:chromate reductase, NAD(P)H dehydrogenase (quinone)
MLELIGLSGSLRRNSYNSALLRAATGLMPEGSKLTVESIREIPLYDGDVEAEGIPKAVARLKEAVVAAEGLLLVTPEYNNSIPGVFKNAIDWLSRPASDARRVFGGKPVALMGASPGGFGTILSQSAWLPVLRTLGPGSGQRAVSSSRTRRAYSTRTGRSPTRKFSSGSRPSFRASSPSRARKCARWKRTTTALSPGHRMIHLAFRTAPSLRVPLGGGSLHRADVRKRLRCQRAGEV